MTERDKRLEMAERGEGESCCFHCDDADPTDISSCGHCGTPCCSGCYAAHHEHDNECWRGVVASLRGSIKELVNSESTFSGLAARLAIKLADSRNALSEYGDHSYGCRLVSAHGSYQGEDKKYCDCGWTVVSTRLLPEERFCCPDCGPGVAADEDGCCANCGADCVIEPSEEDLRAEGEALR